MAVGVRVLGRESTVWCVCPLRPVCVETPLRFEADTGERERERGGGGGGRERERERDKQRESSSTIPPHYHSIPFHTGGLD